MIQQPYRVHLPHHSVHLPFARPAASHLSSGRFVSSSSFSHPQQNVSGRQQQQQQIRVQRRRQRQQQQHPVVVDERKRNSAAVVPQSVAALRDVVGHLSRLQQQVAGQRPLPVWESCIPAEQDEQPTPPASFLENIIATDTLLRDYLSNDIIQANGRHRREFSVMVEHLLRLYAHCSTRSKNDNAPSARVVATQKATALADLLVHYRANILLAHTDSLIAIAARNEDWQTAVRWYHTHLDPAVATPDTDIVFCITGLYCVGRLAQEQGTLPVESVFEAVQKLAMTTPEESEKHILAAGAALGYLGEWEGMREYLKTSFKANKLGQPLVAATMHVCVASSRPTEALAVFDELLEGELAAAAEWQWGGGSDRPHPACRDLALRALGQCAVPESTEAAQTTRDRVLDLYRQAVDDKVYISVEALCGVIQTLGNGGHVEDMIHCFVEMVDRNDHQASFVRSNDLFITLEPSEPKYTEQQIVGELGSLLETVMVACNSHKKFELALFCLQLFRVSTPSGDPSPFESKLRDELRPNHSSAGVLHAILPTICPLPNAANLVNATMVALCGVGAPHRAIDLFDTASSLVPKTMAQSPYNGKAYAELLKASSDPSLLLRWDPVHRHLHRVLNAFATIEESGEALSQADASLLSSVVATTLRECIAVGSPETGLALGVWVERRKLETEDEFPACPVLFSRKGDSLKPVLPFTDGLLSATIASYGRNMQFDVAETLIKSTLGDQRPPNEWLLSYHEAMEVFLSQQKTEDATSTFQTVLESARSPALFCSMARSLKKSGSWRNIFQLYRVALSAGCASDEMSMLALEAVAASGKIGQRDSQLPKLRSIIRKMSETTGVSPTEWTESQYWNMKRVLGFSTSRMIMRWNHYETSRLDELQLAVESIENRSRAGLTPKKPALFTVANAVSHHKRPFPDRSGLPKIPRTKEGWGALLDMVLEEAEHTPLMYEPRFLDAVAEACLSLGRHKMTVDLVNTAISRDVRLQTKALQCADTAAKSANIDTETSNVRLLLGGITELQ